MSSGNRAAGEDRPGGHGLAVRLGGAITGVGIGAGALNLSGADVVFTAWTSVSMLLVGVALLAVGHRGRRKNRS